MLKKYFTNALQSQKVFYRYIRRKGFKRFLKENILESEGSNLTKAKSIALGIFVGLSPFWGFHTFIALSLAVALRLNKFLAFVSTQITFAPLIPFFIWISMMVGKPFVGGETNFEGATFNMEFIKSNLLQYTVGSLILGLVCAVIFGLISYLFLNYFSPQKSK